MKRNMRFDELFEQYGKPVAFDVPSRIAAIKPKPDYRQRSQTLGYQIKPMPAFVSTVDLPASTKKTGELPTDKLMPIRIGKEVIRPNDPRHAAIMSLLRRQR